MNQLRASSFDPDMDSWRPSEIVGVHYDLEILRVEVEFGNREVGVDVLFESVFGFRVLDEVAILEFWGPDQPSGWLWTVDAGGWRDLEKTKGFFGFGEDRDQYTEYLVTGDFDCVSVLAGAPPKIVPAPETSSSD